MFKSWECRESTSTSWRPSHNWRPRLCCAECTQVDERAQQTAGGVGGLPRKIAGDIEGRNALAVDLDLREVLHTPISRVCICVNGHTPFQQLSVSLLGVQRCEAAHVIQAG